MKTLKPWTFRCICTSALRVLLMKHNSSEASWIWGEQRAARETPVVPWLKDTNILLILKKKIFSDLWPSSWFNLWGLLNQRDKRDDVLHLSPTLHQGLRIHTNNWGMWLVDRNQSQESESEVSSYNRRILNQILETSFKEGLMTTSLAKI